MFKLLRNASVMAGVGEINADVLIAEDKIIAVGDSFSVSGMECKEYDLSGLTLAPGFVDSHVHIIGGGGEAGFASRTPEVMLSRIVLSGTTTVVGCLGTDATTRHMESLIAKCLGLEAEGISAYCYTGAYEIPAPTVTGSIRKDIMMIDRIIGAGEIALSDHRSSQPSYEDYIKLVAEARLGGMLSGKAGIVVFHLGDGKNGMKMLFDIVENSEIPITQFIPTHVNRSERLFSEALEWAKAGGYIDITAGIKSGVKPSTAIKQAINAGVRQELILMSSDGNGSMPVFDAKGNAIGLGIASMSSVAEEIKDAVINEGVDKSSALRISGANVAKALRLYPKKGLLAVGSDADITAFDNDMNIRDVWARGQLMVMDGCTVVKGMFE